MDIAEIIERQKAYYATGATRARESRDKALDDLRRALKTYEKPLYEALMEDLHKSSYEACLMELGVVYRELRYAQKHLKAWMKERRAANPLGLWGTKSFVSPEPYGVALIVSPWNYPVNLCLMPLIGALAAGNCAVLKPSGQTPRTAAVLAQLLASVFPDEYVAVLQASREECGDLFRQKWDYIFFTGSGDAGREVMAAASENLVPMTLELGGKNPVIIDPTADLKTAARRIAFGKCVNAGQTCVAPDYVLIHGSVRDAFVEEYRKALDKFFPKGDMSSMASIINDAHYRRITDAMAGENAVVDSGSDPERRFIGPAVLTDVTRESPIMQREVFGPVLPLVSWTDLNWCVDFIHSYEKPLALYIFTGDKTIARRIMDACSFGCGCVNDTMVQISGPSMGFGGVGGSGMGQYHGKSSFDTFTHYRSMMDRRKRPEQPLRYFPFGKTKERLLRLFMR